MSGNEAIARGAYEAGVKCAAGYPGTPSTEILENYVKYEGVYAEWSTNEKVALEVATGMSLGGARALVTMKHVGLNVALDAFMTLAYTGINAGLVVISADDPGMHSSQNEQDNRVLGKFAQVPVLEPANSQEAKDFVKEAFAISEKFDIPVLVRITTRVAHSKSVVEINENFKPDFIKKPLNVPAAKYVMMPMNAIRQGKVLLEKQPKLKNFSEATTLNTEELLSKDVGFITSGISYEYVKEIFPDKSVYKLGMLNPLPMENLKKFINKHKKVYVVEEMQPFVEEQLKTAGFKVHGKDIFPIFGEFTPDIIRECFKNKMGLKKQGTGNMNPVPGRPPVLCAGCPHRGVFYALSKMNLTVTGDIGCYTLGALPPLSAMDTCVDMGASINHAHGLEKAGVPNNKIVAVIGDSTFMHSGLTGIANVVYNRGNTLTIILDNRTTAMTGRQSHPGAGNTLTGDQTTNIDIEKVVTAMGVQHIAVVDPYNMKMTKHIIEDMLTKTGSKVIIAKRDCVLINKSKLSVLFEVDSALCGAAGECFKLGCPAIEKEAGTGKAFINPLVCNGCAMCVTLCPKKAIKPKKKV
ncbi:MAG: indolepyruvate ferredoxin oxidoreductase subunit alpha [bacterium]